VLKATLVKSMSCIEVKMVNEKGLKEGRPNFKHGTYTARIWISLSVHSNTKVFTKSVNAVIVAQVFKPPSI
jgi:hypothetical protein